MLRSRSLFELFYLATPAFVLLDWLVGVPARAAGIPDPGWRAAYYAMLMGCWLLCRYVPGSAPLVGLAESSVNLLPLLLSILLPIWSYGERALQGTGPDGVLAPGALWNLAISGPMLVLSIKANERRILRGHLGRDIRDASV